MNRDAVLTAIADRAQSTATNGGEHAPDLRFIDQGIDEAAKRYKVTLTPEERTRVKRKVR